MSNLAWYKLFYCLSLSKFNLPTIKYIDHDYEFNGFHKYIVCHINHSQYITLFHHFGKCLQCFFYQPCDFVTTNMIFIIKA